MSSGSLLLRPNPGAFVPGQTGLVGAATEWINLPTIAVLAASALLYREMSKPKAQGLHQLMTCDEKYCPPSFLTHVDRPSNTLLKDQSQGAGLSQGPGLVTLRTPYEKTKSDYHREAIMSPGVRLVAHAVV